ncbi:hypothetical protein GDO81_007802 [Engystomops pustulosus]|uniref:Uncharacterized protein n=1 Tax=Engystomops pustulosus TaxID=76066 RepID=A0AAV7CA43_ENGPU|nr:hypothetical protein GDO81_007802 [Engystomops pustulosus]
MPLPCIHTPVASCPYTGQGVERKILSSLPISWDSEGEHHGAGPIPYPAQFRASIGSQPFPLPIRNCVFSGSAQSPKEFFFI